MPIPTPFHMRTSALCISQDWRDWSGYLAVSKYAATHEYEYYSVRSGAGLLDVTPLFKIEVKGPDALRLVDRAVPRDMTKCEVGQVVYTPWCDDEGKVIDDGTIHRLSEDHFRITAADPISRWFKFVGAGLDAEIIEVSTQLAALALQGPKSREILKAVSSNAKTDLDALQYYHLTSATIQDIPLTISRTGYTGDLGYELWVAPEHAERLWDILMDTGKDYGITPIGLIALDMLRVEAGLLLLDIDYISSHKANIEAQKSSPYEIGMGWTVDLDGGDFIGKSALVEEHIRGSKWAFVGLDISWPHLEELFDKVDLPPEVPGMTSRSPVPIFKDGFQIGQATSITFSPLLKKYLAIGTVESRFANIGDDVQIEMTVEYSREKANATLVKTPFYNPKAKRAVLK